MGPNSTITRRHRPLLSVAAAAFALSVAAGLAPAQIAELPADVVTATTLSTPQERAVRTYAERHAESLAAEDAGDRSRARALLLEPLSSDEPSVAFRLAYAAALLPELDRLSGDARAEVRLLAIRIAGELATQDSADLVIAAMASDDPADRVMAAFAMRRLFDALATHPPAVAGNRVRTLVDRVADAALTETDPRVFDSLVRTLAGAAEIQRPNLELRDSTYRMLAETVGARIEERNGLTRTASGLTALVRTADVLLRALRTVEGDPLSNETTRAAARFAGDGLAFSRDAILVADAWAPADRDRVLDLAQTAEAVLAFSATNLGVELDRNALGATARFREDADADAFADGLDRALLGPGAALSRQPFGIDSDRFRRR